MKSVVISTVLTAVIGLGAATGCQMQPGAVQPQQNASGKGDSPNEPPGGPAVALSTSVMPYNICGQTETNIWTCVADYPYSQQGYIARCYGGYLQSLYQCTQGCAPQAFPNHDRCAVAGTVPPAPQPPPPTASNPCTDNGINLPNWTCVYNDRYDAATLALGWNVIQCQDNRIVGKVPCANGCNLSPYGVDDSCSAGSIPTPPSVGNLCVERNITSSQWTCINNTGSYFQQGLYAGWNRVRCDNGVLTSVESCAQGCQTNPIGQDDQCAGAVVPPPPGRTNQSVCVQANITLPNWTCVYNNGSYSYEGLSFGWNRVWCDPYTRALVSKETCTYGCNYDAHGSDDVCSAAPGSGSNPNPPNNNGGSSPNPSGSSTGEQISEVLDAAKDLLGQIGDVAGNASESAWESCRKSICSYNNITTENMTCVEPSAHYACYALRGLFKTFLVKCKNGKEIDTLPCYYKCVDGGYLQNDYCSSN